MLTFITLLHVFVALLLIFLVLIQDSKGGAGGAFGGGSSNSLLGPTGATTLAAKATRLVAVIFAGTCLTLSLITARKTGSVVDSLPAAAPIVPPSSSVPVQPTTPESKTPPTTETKTPGTPEAAKSEPPKTEPNTKK